MKKEDLESCGIYLHGGGWQSPLARDLGVALRTVQRWAAGEFEMPNGAADDLITLVACRWVEGQVKQAASNGLWGAGKLTLKAQPQELSPEMDKAIKTRAADILRSMGINARTVMLNE